jgi:hypothetical protein
VLVATLTEPSQEKAGGGLPEGNHRHPEILLTVVGKPLKTELRKDAANRALISSPFQGNGNCKWRGSSRSILIRPWDDGQHKLAPTVNGAEWSSASRRR